MHTHTHTPTVHTAQNNRLQKTGACTSTTTQVDSCVHQSPVMNIITPATNRLCTVEGTTHYIIQQVSICHKNIQATQLELTDNYSFGRLKLTAMLGYKSSRTCSGHKLLHAAESKAEHRKVLMGIALQGGMGRGRGGDTTH